MRSLFLIGVWFVLTLSLWAQQIQAPPVGFGGPAGAGGPFPFFNSGTINMPADANYTMAGFDGQAYVIRITSAVPLTTTRSIIAPQAALPFFGYEFVFQNHTQGNQSIEIIGATGTGVLIPNGQAVMVIYDGTDYVQVGAPTTAAAGWGNIVPNPFTSIEAAIGAGGGPVVVLPGSTDRTAYTNPANMRIWNFKQNQFGADSLFFRDASEWGVIDGAVTNCSTTAGSSSVSCGATFTNAAAPAGDVGKLIVIPTAGAGTYGQVSGTITVTSTAGLTAGTPNLLAGITFTDAGDCYSNPDGTPNWNTQPYGHIQLDASGLPTGNVQFKNFAGKGCTHPPTTGTIATVGGAVSFTGGAMAPGDLVSTITAVTGANTITLADNATYAVGVQSFYGTDAHDTFQSACNSLSSNTFLTNGTLTFSGIAMISHGVDCNAAGLRILGRGPEGLGSVIIYAGKTPNNMMNGNVRATGGPIATPLVPNSYILNLAQGGAARIERLHLIGNTRAMPYGIINSFGSNCYGPSPGNTDCFQAPGTGPFIGQAHIIDQVNFNPFWGDGVPDLGAPRMQSCIFFAGFTGNADFTTMDHIYCYGADTGMDSVNDQATDLKIGKWQSDYSNIGLSISGGIFIDDYYTEGNRADVVMGSPYWPKAFPTGAEFKNYGGESSAMDFGGMGSGSYNCYSLTFDNGNLGGGPEWRRPDGISADFTRSTPSGSGTICVGDVNWTGESPGNILIPYNFEGNPTPGSYAFNGGFSSTQFRFPAGTCAGNCFSTAGWGRSTNYLKINGFSFDYSTPSNSSVWLTSLTPDPGTGLMSINFPALLDVKSKSQANIGSLNLMTVNWGSGPGIGYGSWPNVICNNLASNQPGYVPCGSTTYQYQITCVDSLGNESAPSPAYNGNGSLIFVASTGPASLSANPANYISFQSWVREGCGRYNLYGDNGLGGVIGFLTSMTSEGYRQTIYFNDHGQWPKDVNHVAPTINQMGSLSVAGHIQIKTLLNAPSLATDALGNIVAGTGGGGGAIVSPFVVPSQDTTQNLTITVPNSGGGNPSLSSSTGTINIAGLFVSNLAGHGVSCLQTDNTGAVTVTGLPCGSGTGGSTPISALTAATQPNAIQNGTYMQDWSWSLTTAGQFAGLYLHEFAPSTYATPRPSVLGVSTLPGSTAWPFLVNAQEPASGAGIVGGFGVNENGIATAWDSTGFDGSGLFNGHLRWSSLVSPDPSLPPNASTIIQMGKHPTGFGYDFSTLASGDISIGLNIAESSTSSPVPGNLLVVQTNNPTTDPLVVNTTTGNGFAVLGNGNLQSLGNSAIMVPGTGGIVSSAAVTSDTAMYSPIYNVCTTAAPCIVPTLGRAPAPRAIGGEPLATFHLHDFSATKPTNGQVPTFNSTLGVYVPITPTPGGGGGPPTGSASGDLSGSYPGPQVVGLMNHPLPTLANGNLNWNGNAWNFSTSSGGGPTFPSKTITGPTYNVIANDFATCATLLYTGTTAITAQLPTTIPPNGQCIWVVNASTNSVTIGRPGSTLMNGSSSFPVLVAAAGTVAPNSIKITSDGTNWTSSMMPANISQLYAGTFRPGTWTIGNGTVLSYTGTGTINANQLLGATIPALPAAPGGYLRYTGSAWNFAAAPSGGATSWDQITNPFGDSYLYMGQRSTLWELDLSSPTAGGWTIDDASSANPVNQRFMLSLNSAFPNISPLALTSGANRFIFDGSGDVTISKLAGATSLAADSTGKIIPGTGGPGGSTSWSALTAPIAYQSLNMGEFETTWLWDFYKTSTGLLIGDSSTGTLTPPPGGSPRWMLEIDSFQPATNPLLINTHSAGVYGNPGNVNESLIFDGYGDLTISKLKNAPSLATDSTGKIIAGTGGGGGPATSLPINGLTDATSEGFVNLQLNNLFWNWDSTQSGGGNGGGITFQDIGPDNGQWAGGSIVQIYNNGVERNLLDVSSWASPYKGWLVDGYGDLSSENGAIISTPVQLVTGISNTPVANAPSLATDANGNIVPGTNPNVPLWHPVFTGLGFLPNGTTGNLLLTGPGCSGGICTMTMPPQDGTYRLTFEMVLTSAAVGCTAGSVQPALTYAGADNNSNYNWAPPFRLITGQALTSSTTFGTAPVGQGSTYIALPQEFRVKGGTAITIRISQNIAAAGCTTDPVWTFRPALYGPLGY